ncbi:hypothetical protein HNQ50_002402 [Silvimonas terrae]|uniref:Uncharacterized protein n=1 Tax=Silvimonas terrae TaxID=300266 RepID=A0A840RHB3_9NEIS|nr:hypothetical protein [Silvimonas terrae]MBB5191672.1 hypothetical protein [Silvimonas terrae]
MVLPGKNTHVFYIHSPITWSMAQAVIAHLGLTDTDIRLIGARGMTGPGLHLTVADDGGVSIADSCAFLQQMLAICEPGRGLVLYLPHSVFLAARILGRSGRVQQIHYLEEGLTSAEPARLAAMPPLLAEAAPLLQALRQHGLIDALQLDPADIARCALMPAAAFDWRNPKYAGSFACSDDTFGGMPQVTPLTLPRAASAQRAQLVSFASVLTGAGCGPDLTAVIEAQCVRVLAMAETMSARYAAEALLFRLHPRDSGGLPRWFYDAWRRYGQTYPRWCELHGLDSLAEPALHHFAHYHVIGHSTQSKYVCAWWGAASLSRVAQLY